MLSAFISALDKYTPFKLGENGAIEYTWSNDIRERIVQLSFQLTRIDNDDKERFRKLYDTTDKILIDLTGAYKVGSLSRDEYLEYMSIMFRMVGHTRDIVNGKGEYRLSYLLLDVWYKHHPELARFAFKLFLLGTNGTHPYGCWKDIKVLSNIYENSPLVAYGNDLLIEQLKKDATSDNPSLAAKWVPREKSKYKKLFNELAITYFSDYLKTAHTLETRTKAITKAKMDFRKLISSLNKKLDTVQIKQCGHKWSEIEPSKQTSITMHKQKKAFLNVKKNGEQRSTEEDRIMCAKNFKSYVKKAVEGEVEIKGKRIGLNDFTKEAFALISNRNADTNEKNILNLQWNNNSKQNGKLGKMIAMVDVSGSMSGDPMYAAIALGIRVAEKSLLGKRVMTFSAQPTWVNLEGHDTFIEMVNVIRCAEWGMNTNFASALKMILDAIISNKLKPEDVEDMVLAVFSDMQIDQADNSSLSMMHTIEQQYADAGNKLWGKPFKAPHILFWNLRSTNGFPTLSTQKNASMMSGFSPVLLNLFCEEGIDALQSCTPWSLFLKSLNVERYSEMDKMLREML